jgi:hypothetical protein
MDAIEAATKLVPEPAWHDGVWRAVRAQLAGDAPWADADGNAAIVTVIGSLGLAYPAVPVT